MDINIQQLIEKLTMTQGWTYSSAIGHHQIMVGILNRYKELREQTTGHYDAGSENPQGDGFDFCEALFFQAFIDVTDNLNFIARNLCKKG